MKVIIKIDQHTKLHEIQSAFSASFPYLKIEFFKSPCLGTQLPAIRQLRSHSETALGIDWMHIETEIQFDHLFKVREIQDIFLRETGLHAQIFRRAGNMWIETSLTEEWTLSQQNREGESFSI